MFQRGIPQAEEETPIPITSRGAYQSRLSSEPTPTAAQNYASRQPLPTPPAPTRESRSQPLSEPTTTAAQNYASRHPLPTPPAPTRESRSQPLSEPTTTAAQNYASRHAPPTLPTPPAPARVYRPQFFGNEAALLPLAPTVDRDDLAVTAKLISEGSRQVITSSQANRVSYRDLDLGRETSVFGVLKAR